ncbi:dihydropteroate synthase [Gryllotalpicola sp.]|uniref:dihydropteroate synthase n=1 Tax=Gryllotalpicola sp. TaxID=1932787 RepID=UPI002615C12F|nr:dihydropteroate synthase [Gryllotalpicola sp.]
MAELYLPPLRDPVRRIGAHAFDFSRQVVVMAVVNRTPDSFYDVGRTFGLDAAVDAALAAALAGADWVDVGGVPFAPGPALPAEEEAERVVPVIRRLRERSDAVISVDTFHAAVARAAIAAGADVVNDTTGIHDLELGRVVADSDATLVITHSLAAQQGKGPRTQFPRPEYGDVVGEIGAFLRSRIELAVSLGIPEHRLIIDPGHDLNKNTLQTLEITRRLSEIADIGLPVLAAASNKDFIGETLDAGRGERVSGSLAAAVFSILQGARIVRMHNVPESVAAVRMTEALLGWRPPAGALVHNMGEFNE